MKLSTSVIGALAALAISAQAATVTVGNLPGFVPVPILGADGAKLPAGSGSASIGIFSEDPGNLGSVDALKAAFTTFGDAVSMGFNGQAGLYQGSVTSTVGGTGFSGQAVYSVIGDGANVASSSALVVIDHGFSFVDEPGATPDAVITSGGNLIWGAAVQGIDVGGTGFDGFQLNPVIPEPSSALLGLLGLSFLCLRRRK